MDSIHELLADPDHFRRWLESQEGAAVIGVRRDGARCPLAQFLRAQTGREVTVGPNHVTDGGGTFSTPLPGWACAFVKTVDGV